MAKAMYKGINLTINQINANQKHNARPLYTHYLEKIEKFDNIMCQ